MYRTLSYHVGANRLAKEFKATLTAEQCAIIDRPFGQALLSARSILLGDLKVLTTLIHIKNQQVLQDIIEQYEEQIAEQKEVIAKDRKHLSIIEKEYFKAVN